MRTAGMLLTLGLVAGLAAPTPALADDDEEIDVVLIDLLTMMPDPNQELEVELSEKKVEVELEAQLNPGWVYNLGICGFNDPASCQEAGGFGPGSLCGWSDVYALRGDPFCLYGGAEIADDDGELEIEVKLKWKHGEPQGQDVLLGPGLTNPTGAEYEFFVHSNGPASTDPAILAEQLSLVDGGCGDTYEVNGVEVHENPDCYEALFGLLPAP